MAPLAGFGIRYAAHGLTSAISTPRNVTGGTKAQTRDHTAPLRGQCAVAPVIDGSRVQQISDVAGIWGRI